MARPSLGAAEWAALIDQWRQSGLSLPAFCRAGVAPAEDPSLSTAHTKNNAKGRPSRNPMAGQRFGTLIPGWVEGRSLGLFVAG
jgi:hypothetical protein